MERRELDEIERFFAGLGVRSPLAYLGLPEDAPPADIEAALKKKRSWAQGQQANPKYRTEAMFIIKFNASLRRLLLEEPDLYRAQFVDGQQAHRVDELDNFIRGALAGGVLTAQVDAAIRVQGRNLEMADHVVEERITALANELGVTRAADRDVGGSAANVDFYDLLQVAPSSDEAAIEAAYRSRYRWARNLADLDRSGKILTALDDAWRILRDPERRARYDQRRAELADVTEEVERRAGELASLVGASGSTSAPPRRSPSNEAMLADIRSRSTLPPTATPPVVPAPPTPVPPSTTGPTPVVATGPSTDAAGAAATESPPLSLVGDAASRHEVSAPLPNIKGRTLGLAPGPQAVRERQPRLVVSGKTIVRLQVPRRRPVPYTVVVQNGGQGRMPGKVVSDAAWLVPDRAWLEPDAREQQVRVEIRPADMPGRVASASLSLVADHGERRVVSFEVRRQTLLVPLGAALGVGLVALGTYTLLTRPPEGGAAASPVALNLRIDPPADRIVVDDVEVGRGATARVEAPNPGIPFRVRIEAAGFVPHEELVKLRDADLEREVRLELDGPVDWTPPVGEPATNLPATAAAPFLARAPELGACFGDGAARKATLLFTLRASADGQVRGYEVSGEGVDLAAGRPCVSRVVRGTRLAPFAGTWSQLSVPVELRVGP